MFTGIIEEMGVVKALDQTLAGTTLRVLAKRVLEDLRQGSSVSVNGCCLTVVDLDDQGFSVEVSPETLAVTNLGTLAVGVPVNLERAMKLNERIGGHMVSGHVDAVGVIAARQQEGNAIALTVDASPEVMRYCVAKGSIAIDGISMTIHAVRERAFTLAVIPHTAATTTLGIKQPGDRVNLETDLIGKYVERLLQERSHLPPAPPPTIDKDYLQKKGLI